MRLRTLTTLVAAFGTAAHADETSSSHTHSPSAELGYYEDAYEQASATEKGAEDSRSQPTETLAIRGPEAVTTAQTATPSALTDSSTEAGSSIEKGVIGLGFMVGRPTGLAGKYYLDNEQAIAATAGAELVGGGWLVAAEWQKHLLALNTTDSYVLPVYVGAGMGLRRINAPESTYRLGPRGTIGVLFDFKRSAMDIFLEAGISPEIQVAGSDDTFRWLFTAALGSRYYF